MPTPLNPPDSPPAEPTIPEGLATKVGKLVAAVLGLVALVTTVLDGDHTAETLTALVLAAITVWTMMGGRYAQAAALFRDVPTPFADDVVDFDEPAMPEIDEQHEQKDLHDAKGA